MIVDITARPSSASPASGDGEEVGSVLLELTVAERFNAVMEVLRDGLTVVEIAERYGVRLAITYRRRRGPWPPRVARARRQVIVRG